MCILYLGGASYIFACHLIRPKERQKQMNNTILRADDTARALGVSRATIWNWVNPKSRHYRPDFPRPFKISANATGWLANEVDDYIGKLAAKREEQAN